MTSKRSIELALPPETLLFLLRPNLLAYGFISPDSFPILTISGFIRFVTNNSCGGSAGFVLQKRTGLPRALDVALCISNRYEECKYV